jgi:erythromycin esterase
MKELILFCLLLCFLSNKLFSQNHQDSIYAIEAIPDNKYGFIDELISGKRIIALGELSHGDGSSFVHKTELIKYLHEKHGFNTVLIESPFAQMELINLYSAKEISIKYDLLKNQVFGIWSNAIETQVFFEYIKSEKISLTGFDCQQTDNTFQIQDSISKKYFKLVSHLKSSSNFINTLTILLDNYGTSRKLISKKDRSDFVSIIDTIIIHESVIKNKTILNSFWEQMLYSIKGYALMCWDKDIMKASTLRDEFMSKNLIWIINTKYKNEKIIIWAATEHLAANGYLLYHPNKKKEKLNYKMGDYLKDEFKNSIYTISFISYKGYNWQWNFTNSHKIIRDDNSLEAILAKKYDFAYVNLNRFNNFKVNGIYDANIAARTFYDWNKLLDGFYFIKEMKPSTKILK